MQRDFFIYDAVRVPSGKMGGMYKNVLSESLAAFLIDNLIERNSLRNIELELILGNSIGTMGNMARYAALESLLPDSVLASTVDLQCGGSYQALKQGLGKIMLSSSDSMVLVGGIESNSLMPFRTYHHRDPRFIEEKHIGTANFSPRNEIGLRKAAENLARKYHIGKDDMTKWTVESHLKSLKFSESNFYKAHVLPFKECLEIDQTIKKGLDLSFFKTLETHKLIDRTNTADYHDGAGILLLGGIDQSTGKKPLAKVMDVHIIGLDPNMAPEGCILAAENLMNENALSSSDIDLFEINESFACKPLSLISHFGLDPNRVNIMGGNLAMGHPFAASGALNIINLIGSLKLTGKKYGLVSAGIAGGYGAAVLIENVM